MKDYQTPQREQSRPSVLANRKSKDSQLNISQKVAKKGPNAAFRSVSEEFSTEITEEPSISHLFPRFPMLFSSPMLVTFALNPSPSASLESFNFSDLTPSSTVIVNKNELSDLSPDHHPFIESKGSKIGLVEADVLAKLLKEALSQVLNSVDVNTRSKKLLESLIKVVVDEFYTIPEERDCFTDLVWMKSRIAFTCFLIWIRAALLIFFFNSGSQRSYIAALPT